MQKTNSLQKIKTVSRHLIRYLENDNQGLEAPRKHINMKHDEYTKWIIGAGHLLEKKKLVVPSR